MEYSTLVVVWGYPDVVAYQDGKQFIRLESVDYANFETHRIAFDYLSRGQRIWLNNGVVDTVRPLDIGDARSEAIIKRGPQD